MERGRQIIARTQAAVASVFKCKVTRHRPVMRIVRWHMLSQTAIDFLSPLTFRANAERRNCLLPLGGIYWDDEIPDFEALLKLPEYDRGLVYRLFSIRFKIWDDKELSGAEQSYWDEARVQVPSYALFHRLKLSAEEQRAQDAVEREAIEGIEALFADAEEIKITENEHGMSSVVDYRLKPIVHYRFAEENRFGCRTTADRAALTTSSIPTMVTDPGKIAASSPEKTVINYCRVSRQHSTFQRTIQNSGHVEPCR